MSTCDTNNNDSIENNFVNYAQGLLKTFVIVVVILFISQLSKAAMDSNKLFYFALLAFSSSFFLSIINMIHPEGYNYVLGGLGVGVGLLFVKPNGI